MTRTRKLTLSVKEFSHLVSESLDMAHVSPSPQSFVDSAVVSEIPEKTHLRPSSFHRIFSRPAATPGQHEDSPEGTPEDLSETRRKMIGWPFSRSPRKNRPTEDEDNAADVKDPVCHSVSPYKVTSLAATSTSSLGSLVPAHDRLFQLTSRDSDEPSQNSDLFRVATSSPGAIALPQASEPPTGSGRYAAANPLDPIFGNGSATSVCAGGNRSMVESASGSSHATRTSFQGTEASHSLANSEPESLDEDPTPRTSTFGPRATSPPAEIRYDPLPTQRGRSQCLTLVVPSQNIDVFALRPAVGVAPHVPSETESLASACSSSPTSPVARDSSPTSPAMRPSGSGTSSPRVPPSTPPNARTLAVFPDNFSLSNLECTPTLGFSPRQRKRAMSRSMTPPPLPRPPPTGPLPAVPSYVPPVPPLPPLLNKISMNMTSHSIISSPPRSTISGAPANPATALPPSPAGALRLPSRLSWVNSVRAVLPSPPASPTKSFKSLSGKTPHLISPSKAEKKRPNELRRPTSIGVIEAADNVQVRRTKSILLLGSRSKSNASLGTKRVQIHADVDLDADTSRKPRRKSSTGMITPMPSSEILLPRERRHSAPLLSSSSDPNAPGASADWTLSLPFCTDVPGNKILLSPLLTPQLKSECALEEVEGEDWTLCMPLKGRADTPTIEASEGGDSECAPIETAEARAAMQLPTPSPSPTWSTPRSVVLPLDPEESIPIPADRPASPANLGPHVGGLDLAGGRGKRASGWHVYGWFDEVSVPDDESHIASTASVVSDSKLVKSHVTVFRKAHDAGGRHPSQESTSTVSTSETMFYSARSSLLVN